MAEGRIIKGIGGFYYVRTEDGAIHECRAKGKFRRENITPLIGDRVIFSLPSSTSIGVVEGILPRRNMLVRPAVANIDLLVIVISADKPEPDLVMADKLLLYAEYNSLDVVIAVNKMDAGEDRISCQYVRSGVPVLQISANTGQGMEAFKDMIGDRCVCLAGQSAVGKSSIINSLMDEKIMDVGGLSAKTDRGTHTTRHSELLCIPGCRGTIIDTPGFSILQAMEIMPEELGRFYRDFDGIRCRFHGCLHKSEPGCGVKLKAAADTMFSERYIRYIKILDEIVERKEKEYD